MEQKNNQIFEERQNELNTIMIKLDQNNTALSEKKDDINKSFKLTINLKEQHNKSYEQKKNELIGKASEKLDLVHNYNELLYMVEYKRYIMKLSRVDEKLKYNYLYLDRCVKYIKYLQAYFKGNEFLKLQAYYDLVNALQTEIIEKETNRINIAADRIDLDDSYKELGNNEFSKNFIFNILDDISRHKIIKSGLKAKKNKEEDIELFRENKLEIDDDILVNTSFMNYIVEDLISLLYSQEVINKVSNTKEEDQKVRKAA